MKERYDIIVVGGGPGGLWAAKHAAERGASVLVLEKDREIGIPVRCAEGVSEDGIKSVIDLREHWIAVRIRGAKLVAPNGTEVVSYPDDSGFILHRELFEKDLASMVSECGGEIATKAYVCGLLIDDRSIHGVRVLHLGKEYKIKCSVVIGADSVESRVGRWAGLNTRTSVECMASCVQMRLTGIEVDPEVVEFYFGKDVAPEGYLWVFPKGQNSANVGLGMSGKYPKKKRPISYLEEFIRRKYKKYSILNIITGGVPLIPTMKEIVSDGLMLVGDAAHQANPMSGGGIVNAMIAGRIAGKVAAEAVKEGDVSRKRLSIYQREWYKAEGKNNEISYKIKRVIDRFSDSDLNKIADTLLQIPPEKRSALRIFKVALLRHPKLMIEAAKVFI